MPIYATPMPLNVYLPAILTQSYGIPLVLSGVIFLIEKLRGAAADSPAAGL
jgi:Na+/melibiose symporter-like transporter